MATLHYILSVFILCLAVAAAQNVNCAASIDQCQAPLFNNPSFQVAAQQLWSGFHNSYYPYGFENLTSAVNLYCRVATSAAQCIGGYYNQCQPSEAHIGQIIQLGLRICQSPNIAYYVDSAIACNSHLNLSSHVAALLTVSTAIISSTQDGQTILNAGCQVLEGLGNTLPASTVNQQCGSKPGAYLSQFLQDYINIYQCSNGVSNVVLNNTRPPPGEVPEYLTRPFNITCRRGSLTVPETNASLVDTLTAVFDGDNTLNCRLILNDFHTWILAQNGQRITKRASVYEPVKVSCTRGNLTVSSTDPGTSESTGLVYQTGGSKRCIAIFHEFLEYAIMFQQQSQMKH